MPLQVPEIDFSGFDAAVQQKMLPDLDSVGHRLKVYRRRLYWLGYLEEEGPEVTNSELVTALTQFQQDVGLNKTGKTDKPTFNALDALIAFEPQDGYQAFLQSLPDGNVALVKARAVRLKTFGLLDENSSSEDIEQAVQQFNELCYALLIPGISLGMKARQLDDFLFDLDKVTMGLQGDASGLNFRYPPDIASSNRKKRQFSNTLNNYIYHLAAIELWLSGYPVKLNKLNTQNDNFQSSLKQFWADAPDAEKPPGNQQDIASFAFFKRINNLQNTPINDRASQQALLNRLQTQAEFRDGVEKASQSFVSRLYDGVKRAIKMVFDFIKRGIEFAASVINNSARWFVSSANTIYQGVATIFKAAQIGWDYVSNENANWILPDGVSNNVTDTDPVPNGATQSNVTNYLNSIIIIKDSDFDHSIYVDPTGNKALQQYTIARYQLAGSIFAVALDGITAIWNVLKALIGSFTGVTSWFLALWSLLKLPDNIEDISEVVARAKQLLTLWDQSSTPQI